MQGEGDDLGIELSTGLSQWPKKVPIKVFSLLKALLPLSPPIKYDLFGKLTMFEDLYRRKLINYESTSRHFQQELGFLLTL